MAESRGRPFSVTEVRMRLPSVAKVIRFSRFGGPVEMAPLLVSWSIRNGAVSGCFFQSHSASMSELNRATPKIGTAKVRTVQPGRATEDFGMRRAGFSTGKFASLGGGGVNSGSTTR